MRFVIIAYTDQEEFVLLFGDKSWYIKKTKKKEERIALSHLSRAHCSAICFHGLEGKTHTFKNKRESSPNEFDRKLYKTGITGCFFDHNFNKWHHNVSETSYFLETSPSVDSEKNLLDGPVWSQFYHYKSVTSLRYYVFVQFYVFFRWSFSHQNERDQQHLFIFLGLLFESTCVG